MRVIIDIRPLLEPRRSGVGTYTAEIVKALAARGRHDYALFANGLAGEPPADLPPASATVARHFSRYPNRLLNASIALLGAPTLETLAGAADVAYLPNLNFVATSLPLIVTVHDLSFIRFPRFFSAKQRLWHAAVGAAGKLRRATTVIAVSEHTKRDIIETFGIPAERIEVASPGVSPAFAPKPEEAAATLRRLGLQRPYFLFLGSLEPRKNITGLIDAFDKVSADQDLVIAGGKGWLYRDIFRRAAASPKRGRIRFLEYVDDADKPGLYAGATALVYPSFYEGFGMPPLEAMACGTPVIASHVSSLGEVVGDAGLLVDPHAADDIAAAMTAVVEDGRLAAELRRRGPERAKRYTWEKSAETLERVFSVASSA
ncbi:MAG TPA: glycosyltransferase family 1 protein [Candidatus Eisenbacteria bacterium]|jgi:glycosyltransferase involved in cell wall biosynthesis|nr:glycosyltransferase family 1 protein [Candidatus Eisenbacteria bacterium]